MSDIVLDLTQNPSENMTPEELARLHETMRAPGRRKKRAKTTALVLGNVVVALVILLPLLYSISIALMPSSDLYTMSLNLVPAHPTLDNFKEALTKVPLLRFVLNSFLVAGVITLGQVISCSLAAFSFTFLDFKGKNALFKIGRASCRERV